MRSARIFAVAVACLIGSREGHTSYHSSVSKSSPGLTVSVGFSDLGDRPGGPSLEELRGYAQKRLAASAARVERLYAHFAKGEHRFRRLRALLSPLTTFESGHGFAIAVMSENSLVDGWGHLRATAADPVAEKLSFDFALSQLAKGGAADKPGQIADESIGGSLIAPVAFDPNPASVASQELSVEFLRQREGALRALAGAADLKDQPARGQWVARAYLTAFDDQPLSPSLFAQLESFTAAERAHGLKLLILLLSDSRWQAGVAAVRAHAAGDADFAAWLEPLLKAY